jgi:uncharacterized protein (TIGR02996 family)
MDTAVLHSFLDDIKANPLDDARRLILADWLEEHGDTEADRARGELMRLQVQIDNNRFHYAVPHLGHRVQELQTQHNVAWAGELIRISARRRFFLRGMLGFYAAASTLLAPDIRRLLGGPTWPWVERLQLHGSTTLLPRLLRRPELRSITTLVGGTSSLSFSGIVHALCAAPDFDGLRVLGFSSIGYDGIGTLTGWPGLANLHHLALYGWSSSELGLGALTASGMLGELRQLDIHGPGIGTDGFTALARCPEVTRLERLTLENTQLDEAAFRALSAAKFAPSLRRLHLGNNNVGAGGAAVLAQTPMPHLEGLSLSSASIDPPALGALCQAPWLPHTRSLTLNVNPLGTAASQLLAAPLRALELLNLSACHLKETALRPLASNPNLGQLRVLSMGDNPELGDGAAADLVACANLPGLVALELYKIGLGSRGAAALATWPGLARLRYLDIRSNNLDDASLRQLLDSPLLHPECQVHLWGNNPSPDLRAALRPLYPRITT